MNSGDYFEMVTGTHMKFTEHDCYKSVTQRVQEKCFDLPVCDFEEICISYFRFFLE
jgi:hypothetical protein